MNRKLLGCFFGLVLCVWSSLASSAGSEESNAVELELGFRVDVLNNVRGGLARRTSAVGLFDLQANIDLYKSAGGSETRAFINLLHHVGDSPNEYTGSLTGVSNIEVLRNTTRFYQLWVEHEVPVAAWRSGLLLGLLRLEDEFFTMESAGNLIHPTGGPQGDLALTRGPAIYPNASFGLRWKIRDTNRGWYAMAAVLDGIAGSPTNPRATHPMRFVRGHGVHLIAELGHAPLAEAKAKGEASEEFNKTAVALWRYNPRDVDLLNVRPDGSPEPRLSWGWYALAERTLFKGSGESPLRIAGFLRLSGSDGDTAPIDRSLNAGLRAAGLVSSRPQDVLSLMIVKHRMASKWQEVERLAGRAPAGREDLIEINYQMPLHENFRVMPLVQWWDYPGAHRTVRRATVLGARLIAEF
jgi:porin